MSELFNNFDKIIKKRLIISIIIFAAGMTLSLCIHQYNILDQYIQLVMMYVGINIILTLSLNLINGYMGEFSVGHAGFMAVGAYVSSMLSVRFFNNDIGQIVFPIVVLIGGICAGFVGLIVAVPSFRIRGDYLAIVTLSFNMIVKSGLENVDSVGGARGFLGMSRLTTLPWVMLWTFIAVWIIRNFVNSSYGRGVLSIREDETASSLMTVNTQKIKVRAFMLSSFFAGIAGALYAHLIQFISPRSFDLIKSTEMLIMVYLGGIGSIGGSILGASVYTILLELLRPLGIWRMVLMPLLLVILMIYRPNGIMGLREFSFFKPAIDRFLRNK
ncbi:MAG: branched-chain amino acid ABC transporter permease [Nitrospirae bacterium]|nr:branched-chain amino acid ABC transporter permease [Nitrospirota bacterium]MBF0541470.1 branched-chain amino acid ABC transporter permease [Nitrospirota bacterium]